MKVITQKEFAILLSENAYKNDIPVNGSFEITPLCNLNCKMCYVHMEKNNTNNQILTGKQWISIMQEAVDCGMTSVLLTGGEALLHPDFWMIYDWLVQAGVMIRLKSNGILLNKTNLEKLKIYPPAGIDISLYGCDSNSYISVTGKDVFDLISENINDLIKSGISTRLMITPSTYMMPWLKEIMEFAKTFDLPVVVNTILFEANENTGREKITYDLTVAEYIEVSKMKKELLPNKYITKDEEKKVLENFTKRKDVYQKGLYCNGGRTSFSVFWDGIMGPCLSFPREVICSDVIKNGFIESWKEINAAVKAFEVPNKCHICGVNKMCHYCPAQHSKYSKEQKCDPKICEFWETLYFNRNNL